MANLRLEFGWIAGEIAAVTAGANGVDPTLLDSSYPVGVFERYGAIADGSTDASNAIRAACIAVNLQGGGLVKAGLPGGVYRIFTKQVSGFGPLQNASLGGFDGVPVIVDLQGCTLAMDPAQDWTPANILTTVVGAYSIGALTVTVASVANCSLTEPVVMGGVKYGVTLIAGNVLTIRDYYSHAVGLSTTLSNGDNVLQPYDAGYLFEFIDCPVAMVIGRGIVTGSTIDTSAALSTSPTFRGREFMRVQGACRNVELDAEVNNCLAIFNCSLPNGSTLLASERTSGVRVRVTGQNNMYGVELNNNGDNADVACTIDDCHRSYVIESVAHVKAIVTAKNNKSTAQCGYVNDVDITYSDLDSTTATGGQSKNNFQWLGPTPGLNARVKFTFNVAYAASGGGGQALTINKYNADLSADQLDHGHRLDGLEITGHITGVPSNTTNPTITAGAFVVGVTYAILTVGTTNFTLIGATANTIGVLFTATGVGSGTGTASDTRGTADATVPCIGMNLSSCFGPGDAWTNLNVHDLIVPDSWADISIESVKDVAHFTDIFCPYGIRVHQTMDPAPPRFGRMLATRVIGKTTNKFITGTGYAGGSSHPFAIFTVGNATYALGEAQFSMLVSNKETAVDQVYYLPSAQLGEEIEFQRVANNNVDLNPVFSTTVGRTSAATILGSPVNIGDTFIPCASTAGILSADTVVIGGETRTVNSILSLSAFSITAGLSAGHLTGVAITRAAVAALAGDTAIWCASVTGIGAGDPVNIDGEARTVGQILSTTSFSITAGLTSGHAVGTTVTRTLTIGGQINPGDVLRLQAVGDLVRLRCVADGTWTIVRRAGTLRNVTAASNWP